MEQSRMIHVLHCNYTGVALGKLDLTLTAGHAPYMSHWNDMICHHPLFSLSAYQLVAHMEKEWERLAQAIADEVITERETLNLQVGFVALLHTLKSIRQDRGSVGIPDLLTVQTNLESLVALNKWYYILNSQKFAFPLLHISKLNDNATHDNIRDYLKICWQAKEDYNKGLNEAQELERSRIAEKALLAIRDSWMKPTGKKLLWQYCKGYLTGKWAVDRDNWMRSIFLSSSATITDWEMADIDLLEEIIFSEIPTGDSISFAIRERINQIRDTWKLHYDAFEIEESTQEFIDQLGTEHKDEPMPLEKDFKSKALFYVAKAKWELANPSPLAKQTNIDILNARKKFDDQNDKGL